VRRIADAQREQGMYDDATGQFFLLCKKKTGDLIVTLQTHFQEGCVATGDACVFTLHVHLHDKSQP